MRKETSEWSIRMLADFRVRINVEAEYQRGTVWSQPQQALLIDSIMRGFDIPKIFLRKRSDGSAHLFDLIDGKQRLTAIWTFLSDGFPLLRLDPFPEFGDLGGKQWSERPEEAKDKLQFSNVTVSKIEEATDEEIRELFLRLQKGNPLNAAEKRNAVAGPLRDFVADVLAAHRFWPETAIKRSRRGWDEHSAIVLELVRKQGPTGLKGADLGKLYELDDFNPGGPDAILALEVLDTLYEIGSCYRGFIRTRWGVVDLSIATMRLRAQGQTVDPPKVMEFFERFEEERRRISQILADVQTKVVELSLDDDEVPDDEIELSEAPPDMLKYHMAFSREGASKENVQTRSEVLCQRLLDFLAEQS